MAIFLQNSLRLPVLVTRKNVLTSARNHKRFIMTTCPKLEKVLEDLQKNPFFDKYAAKIAKLQQTKPEEFLERVESREKRFQTQKVRICSSKPRHVRPLWMLLKGTQPLWSHIRRCYCSGHTAGNMYITTPIFYVNAGPHIGHAYTAVLADAVARFKSMQGYSVFLCTGTDEHGTKVEKAAKTADLPIPEYCTKISSQFQGMCDALDVHYSRFVRTTERQHKEAVDHFWRRLEEGGHIYLGKYSGWYNVSEEAFVSNAEVTRRNPLNNNEAFTESGDVVEWTEEDTYKFRLSSFVDDLKYWLKDERVIHPAIYRNTLLSWLDDLQDLSISRPAKRVPWAIPTPSDETQTTYVWLDALVNYLTSLGYPDDTFRQFWPPTVQVIGKDILKFHGIYWPAFLMAAGLEPPNKLLCHGHWTVDDEKMSKSKGNVISPFAVANYFTEDGLRYFLLREAVLHADANYNGSKVQKILNSELADTLGNLINRCFGRTINPGGLIYNSTEYKNILKSDIAVENITSLEELGEKAGAYYEECHLHHAVDAVMHTLHFANRMFDYHKPWHLCKSKDDASAKELEAVISLVMENIRVAALVLHPIIPRLTSNLLDYLQISETCRTWNDTRPVHLTNLTNGTRPVSTRDMLFFKKIKN